MCACSNSCTFPFYVFHAFQLQETKERLTDALGTICAKEYLETEHELIVKVNDMEIDDLKNKLKKEEKRRDILKFVVMVCGVVVVNLGMVFMMRRQ